MLGIAAFVIAQSQSPNYVQPIEPGPILAIHARLGNEDQIFGIDTGSFRFLLKPSESQPLGSPVEVSMPFLSNEPAHATLANFPSRVTGVIGLNLIKSKAIGIDAQGGSVSFWNAGNLTSDQLDFWFSHTSNMSDGSWASSPAVGYDAVDLEDAGDGHFIVDAKLNGVSVKLGLDTDASISTIDGSAEPKTGFQALGNSNLGGLNGNWKMRIGVVDSIMFGAQELKSVPIAEAPPKSLGPVQGLLGYDLFQGRKAIIDFPAHKLYFGKFSDTPSGPEALSGFGIRLAPFVQGAQLIGVIPDSPAARAGLRSGDQIVEVDGQAVSAANLPKTGSSLPNDYSKLGLPKSLKVLAKAQSGETKTYEISLT